MSEKAPDRKMGITTEPVAAIKVEWGAELLRLTAFCMTPPDISTINWWTELTGRPSDSRTLRLSAGEFSESGQFEGRSLRLQINLDRVDWFLSAAKAEESTNLFDLMGSFPESVPVLQSIAEKWFQNAPDVRRIAFGALLFIPTDSASAACRHLTAYLPNIKLDCASARDFIYRINRPRLCKSWSTIAELNRLAKWELVTRRKLVASFDLSGSGTRQRITGEQIAAHLELDLNTAGDFTREISRDVRNPIFSELVELGKELAEKGDVA